MDPTTFERFFDWFFANRGTFTVVFGVVGIVCGTIGLALAPWWAWWLAAAWFFTEWANNLAKDLP